MYYFNIKIFISIAFTFIFFDVRSQTLIMNEVSNGISGSGGGAQEYVEFVVVSNAVTYTCTNTSPPCIDIRGWIYDDNNGYHGTDGIATGAVRFSFDPMWQCVPLGTIILIYNNTDKNPAIPPDDLSMTDGNCKIIAPINNTSLFDRNLATPGAAACSYPATGWVPGGTWSYTGLLNNSDCSRIVNLAGCEVFSVCYGAADNLNTMIYFSGLGTGKVYFFNSGNPSTQSNWTSGNSTTMQTPGAPNNAANASYIAQFNNGCLPITQLTVTATAVNAGCTCNGSATANSSGSIGGYTYVWCDANMNPIGQTAATATGLCAGVYNVTSTSQIGCTATTSVTITSSSTTSISVNSQTICAGTSAVLTATPSTAGGTFSWSPGGLTTSSISVNPSSTTTYSVIYTIAGCGTTNNGIVTVNPLPSITVNSQTICAGQTVTLTANGASTYTWNTSSSINPLIVSPTSTTNYTVIGSVLGCTNTAIATISVTPIPTITVNSPTLCAGQTATLTANGASAYTWSNGSSINPLVISPSSTTNYTVGGSTSGCTSTIISTVSVIPIPTLSINSLMICLGQSATLTAIGATTYSWNTGASSNTITDAPTSNTNYTVTGTTFGCTNTAMATITVNPLPSITVNSQTICAGQTVTLTANGASTYIWNTSSSINPLIVSPTSTTNYTVVGSVLGCTNTAIATISVTPIPTITVNSPTLCAGQTATLTANGASAYTWSNGLTTNTISVNPITSTSYSVLGTNGICNSTTTIIVTINQVPIVTVSSKTICAGQSATLTANGATSFSWSNNTFNNPLIVFPNSTTIYSVTGTNLNCSASATAAVSVEAIPTINFNSNQTSGCAPLCIQFTDFTTIASGSILNWSWVFNDGFTSNSQNPSHCFDNVGSYNITLTVTSSKGCSNLLVNPNMINVYPNPNAEFQSDFKETNILNPIINFSNLSSNANAYVWNFGDTTSTLINPTHAYDNEGTYSTTLTATNQFGCRDVAIHDVIVKGIFTFYAPNTFTPNDDNLNDVFIPLGVGWNPDKYKLEIFDRWGNNCFNTSEIGRGWDGKANNGISPAQIDTYTWKVYLTDVFGTSHNYIGRITIIR
jgi:gliding motility-associated-like protein